MGLLLVVAFLVVPIVELYVLIQVGHAIGVLPTVALLVADAVLGAALVRWQGRKTWAAFRAATAAGRLPTTEVADGALVIFGGALLLTPGFTTDLLGLLCVLPPTRAVLRRVALAVLTRRLGLLGLVTSALKRPRRGARGPRSAPGSGGRVVDGEVVDGEVVDHVVVDGPVSEGGPAGQGR